MILVFAPIIGCKSKKDVIKSDNNYANEISKVQSQIQFGNLFINGCTERMKGNYVEAKKLFEACLKLDPSDVAPHYELAMINKLQGLQYEALNNAKLCASANQKNEWYQILLAECFVATKQYQQAIKVRENLVKNFKDKREFKEELAIEYMLAGQNDKALKIYNELENAFGTNEQLTLNKVRILKNSRSYIQAEKELLNLLTTDKNQIRYYNYLAELYAETRELDKAKGIYEKIIELDPNNPTIYLAMHDYHIAKGNEKEAFEDLLKAIKNPMLDIPSKTQILEDYYNRAEKGNQSSFEKGLLLAQQAVKVHPRSSNINAICGDFYKLDRKLKESANYYYVAATSEKNNYNFWQNLIITEYELSSFDSLAKHSNLAIESFPSQPVFYLYNGLANASLKNYSKAKNALKEGLALSIGNKRLSIDFLSALGDNYYQMKDYENAYKSFEEALKLDSDNSYVLNNYAYYLSMQNAQMELAEKLSRRANELKPNIANYMDTYGWIFFKQKKYALASEWLNNAAKLSQSATILEHLGDVLYQLNKIEDALIQWNKSKAAGNQSPILIKKINERKWYE